MKHDPITRRDQAHLIHLLHEKGTFEGTRGGCWVTLKIRETLFGKSVAYQVNIAGRQHRGEAGTVAEAVDALNQTIRHSSEPAPRRA